MRAMKHELLMEFSGTLFADCPFESIALWFPESGESLGAYHVMHGTTTVRHGSCLINHSGGPANDVVELPASMTTVGVAVV
jgi:hypothetical protein